jgi:hypothetical protein
MGETRRPAGDPQEWSDEYWQLDQAILDASQYRSSEQIARLERIRDGWDAMAADASLGAALRAAIARLARRNAWLVVSEIGVHIEEPTGAVTINDATVDLSDAIARRRSTREGAA